MRHNDAARGMGLLTILWSIASIGLWMSVDMLFADKAYRLPICALAVSIVAVPLLLPFYQRWRVFSWVGTLIVMAVLAKVPWNEQKRLYLTAESISPGTSIDRVQFIMSDFLLRNPDYVEKARKSKIPVEIQFGWSNEERSSLDSAIFLFQEGRMISLRETVD